MNNLFSADDSSSAFRKFSYKEMTNATNDFNTVIGQGGFGTVYKAEFSDGLIAAVKKMNKVSEQAEQDFCREIGLLAKLHHRNLVALKGFCINKKERWRIIHCFFAFCIYLNRKYKVYTHLLFPIFQVLGL